MSAEIECLIYEAVNAERVSRGLHRLDWDSELLSLAREHSEDMAKHEFFSHERSPGYRNLGLGMGENCFKSYFFFNPPEEIARKCVDTWMSSSGHKANVLDKRYLATGVGIVFSDGDCYVTQIFRFPRGIFELIYHWCRGKKVITFSVFA